jgi:syntaxin-binding protein 1
MDFLSGKLTEKEFVWIDKPDSEFKIETFGKEKKEEKKEDKEGERKKSRFGNNNGPKIWDMETVKEEKKEEKLKFEGSEYRLFVFIIGGMTHSEMRSCYELECEKKLDVCFGSTSIITPNSFLNKIGQLTKK